MSFATWAIPWNPPTEIKKKNGSRFGLCQRTTVRSKLSSKNKQSLGWSPGLVVKRGDSHSEGCEFNSRHWVLDGHFFTLVCSQFCIVCFKKNKNKRKRGRGWPTFKRNIANSATKTYHKCVPLQKCVILNVALFTCDRRIFTEDVVSYFCVEHRLSHLQRRHRQSVGP